MEQINTKSGYLCVHDKNLFKICSDFSLDSNLSDILMAMESTGSLPESGKISDVPYIMDFEDYFKNVLAVYVLTKELTNNNKFVYKYKNELKTYYSNKDHSELSNNCLSVLDLLVKNNMVSNQTKELYKKQKFN